MAGSSDDGPNVTSAESSPGSIEPISGLSGASQINSKHVQLRYVDKSMSIGCYFLASGFHSVRLSSSL